MLPKYLTGTDRRALLALSRTWMEDARKTKALPRYRNQRRTVAGCVTYARAYARWARTAP